MTQSVSTIAVTNDAAMDIQFKIEIGGMATGYTDYYPVGETRSMAVSSLFAQGTPVGIAVHADAGVTEHGSGVVYEDNGNTATFKVTGTTQSFSVELIGG
jgi:hypothetical protein